jgi:hypothetical protein
MPSELLGQAEYRAIRMRCERAWVSGRDLPGTGRGYWGAHDEQAARCAGVPPPTQARSLSGGGVSATLDATGQGDER